jgi:flagellar basal-body rod modification protein FlgD
MTAIDPFSTVRATQAQNARPAPDDQMGQDTFLKLLVAQLKYQNPLAPTDGTEFLTQSAQFTMVEKLSQIEKQQAALATTNNLLAASTMVGAIVTYGVNENPKATSTISVGGSLPKDAAVGTRVSTTTDVFTSAGQKVPLKLEFTRSTTGWDVRASSNGTSIGNPFSITFDGVGERTSSDVSIPAAGLDLLAGTTGTWPAAGITLQFGTATDPNRLHVGEGVANVAVREQNGTDGQTRTGYVTGIKVTADGASVQVNGSDIPVSSVVQVKSPLL